jgi:WD40 repeat protein
MAFKFLKSLDADDIFISYSRADGGGYVKGIIAALSKEGFSCFSDKFGTDANRLPPETLYQKVRNCKTLVLLGTPKALEKQENIAPEVIEFAKANGTARIVPVSFDLGMDLADWSTTRWYPQVEGKSREREDVNTLTTGEPSPAIVASIATASNYMKGKDRLRKYRNRALAGFVGLLVAGLLAGAFAFYGFRQARNSSIAAQNAQAEASQTIAKAHEDAEKAVKQAQLDIQVAKDNAQIKIQKAEDEAKTKIDKADILAKAADEKRVKAERLQANAQAEAQRQQTIGSSRSLANRAQTMLRQRPTEIPRSLSLAVDSLKKSADIGVHVIEADSAVRDTLALFPHLSSRQKYTDSVSALSPDGRYYAVSLGEKLRIWEPNSENSPKEIDCECSTVALSSKPLRVATVTEGGIKIFDVEDSSSSHLVKLAEGISAEKIALSPDGSYLAIVSVEGEDVRFSKMWVINTATGKIVKAADGDPEAQPADDSAKNSNAGGDIGSLGVDLSSMAINDIAFARNGDLAVGGKSQFTAGGKIGGKVIIWPVPDEGLSDSSFSDPEVIAQESEVYAVAPGTDISYFATDQGVWKRSSGKNNYEAVARLPRFPEEAGSQIERMAFSPDAERLAVVRSISGLVDDPEPEEKHIWELWDGIAQSEVTKVFHGAEISHVGFKPESQFVSTMTDKFSSEEPARVFQTDTGSEVAKGGMTLAPEDNVIYFSPDAAFLIAAGDESIQILDAWEQKRTTVQFSQALQKVEVAALSPGGNTLALTGPDSGGGQAIVVYRKNGDTYAEWKRLPQNNAIEKMVLSADGQRMAVLYHNDSNFARVFDLDTGKDVMTRKLEQLTDVKIIMLSPDGRFFVAVDRTAERAGADRPNRTQLLDLTKGVTTPLLDDTLVECISFSPDGRYLGLGSDEGNVHVFATSAPEDEIARLQHIGRITAIAFSDNDKYVATASSDFHPYHIKEEESYPLRIWLLQPKDLIAAAENRLARLAPSPKN